EKGEAGLHEHHEHGRDDNPEGVRGDQELRVAHAARSSGRPVRWWMTFSTGVVQTSPSPDSLPLRAASAIVSATSAANESSTTNVSSAFGRKRDSNTRPRYSCVIPRSRPWPTASTTVTPTWPVCSSTASITISTRSRRTTASTLVIGPPLVVSARTEGLSLGHGPKGRVCSSTSARSSGRVASRHARFGHGGGTVPEPCAYLGRERVLDQRLRGDRLDRLKDPARDSVRVGQRVGPAILEISAVAAVHEAMRDADRRAPISDAVGEVVDRRGLV